MVRTIRRIVVALDDSAESRSVLEAAVSLAARMKAELAGLFVEDATLISAAQLNFIRQVSLSGEAIEAMDSQSLERSLRGQAEAIRAEMQRAAGRHNLTWSFRVARGKASVQILAAVAEADLVIMGKTTPAVTRRHHLGATAKIVATQPRGSILFSEPRLRRVLGGPGPITVAYGQGPTGGDVLDMAVLLARASEGELLMLIPADTPDDGAAIQRAVSERMAQEGLRVRFRRCAQRGAAALTHALAAQRGNLLVIAQDSPLLGDDTIADLIEALDSPVLVVAPNGAS
jgi:nucleotide-binding universal stress UspA family protein